MTDPDVDYEPATSFAGIDPDETWTYRDVECHLYHIENPEYSEDPTYFGTYLKDNPETESDPEEQLCYELSEHDWEADHIETPGPAWSDKDYEDPAEIVKDGVESTVDSYLHNKYGEPVPEDRQVESDVEIEDLFEDDS